MNTLRPKGRLFDKQNNNLEINPYTKTDAVLTNSEKRLSKWMTKTELNIKETKKKCKPQYVVINKGIKFGNDNVLYYSERGRLRLIISSKHLCYKVRDLEEYKNTAPTREEFIDILNEALPENLYIENSIYNRAKFISVCGGNENRHSWGRNILEEPVEVLPKLILIDAFLDLYSREVWPCTVGIEILVPIITTGCVFYLKDNKVIIDSYKGLPTRSKHWAIGPNGKIVCVTPPTELRYYLKWKLDRKYKISNLDYEEFKGDIETLRLQFNHNKTRGELFLKHAVYYKGTSSLHTIYCRRCPDNKFIVRKVYQNKYKGRWSIIKKVE